MRITLRIDLVSGMYNCEHFVALTLRSTSVDRSRMWSWGLQRRKGNLEMSSAKRAAFNIFQTPNLVVCYSVAFYRNSMVWNHIFRFWLERKHFVGHGDSWREFGKGIQKHPKKHLLRDFVAEEKGVLRVQSLNDLTFPNPPMKNKERWSSLYLSS